MTDNIYQEMMEQSKRPDVVVSKFIVGQVNQSIGNKFLSTKQTLHFTGDEVNALVNGGYVRLNEVLNSHFYSMEGQQIDVSKYTDGYQVSEYFGKAGIFIPDFDYMEQVLKDRCDAIMTVYNGNDTNFKLNLISDKIKEFDWMTIPGNYPFKKVTNIVYSRIKDPVYVQKNRIYSYQFSYPTLSVNLPYEYYSMQAIPENIYTYDIDKNAFSFAGKTNEEVDALFDDICTNGIQKQMFFQVRNGKLVSGSDEDYLILLIANYLKLPSIPVTLYIMNNNATNNILNSTRPFDIINVIHKMDMTKKEFDIIAPICAPNFLFYDTSFCESSDDDIKYLGRTYDRTQYLSDTNIDSIDSNGYTDYYKKESVTVTEHGFVVDDPQAYEEQLKKEIQDKMSAEITAAQEQFNSVMKEHFDID